MNTTNKSAHQAIIEELCYQRRNCEVCGSNSFDKAASFSEVMHINTTTRYKIDANIVVCKDCGFVFSDPCPTQESLEKYYKDSFSLFSGQDSYSIDSRMEVIKSFYSPSQSGFVEIGGNDSRRFHLKLKQLFEHVISVEVNSACDTDISTIDKIQCAENSVDMAGLYFVLEHIPNLNETIENVSKILKIGGIMIIEVPNIYEYPYDIAGFFLVEHVNHFSPYSLAALASKYKFKLVFLSKSKCSRNFGFVAVFVKTNELIKNTHGDIEYLLAKDNIICANNLLQSRKKNINMIVNKINEMNDKNKKVVIWCANAYCEQIIDNYINIHMMFPGTVIDSDIRKKDYFSDKPIGIQVLLPQNAKLLIQQADLIIICSKVHRHTILEIINDNHVKNAQQRIFYVDDLFSLNSLE
ncbi:MAG: class I SAM-dependent methyltransferase [Peptococcaceae bacterium]|nr:class I SAM-dependent methyltransferase [Peptococcaceae bacterium]